MARVKSTFKKAESSCTGASQPKIFLNVAAATRYSTNILKRPFCFELGFLLKEKPYMGYDESISSIVEKHNWSRFCLHLGDDEGKVVREFYAHVNSSDFPFIYVRGKSVPFDEDHINAKLGIEEVRDEHSKFSENIT
ncbi:hypothetical protein V6Z11_D12G108400 [Gossypium hirsutum]